MVDACSSSDGRHLTIAPEILLKPTEPFFFGDRLIKRISKGSHNFREVFAFWPLFCADNRRYN